MTASQQKRFELREGLIDLLGQDKAETLMEALPPVSWDQLTTKNDLNTLVVVIGAEFTKVASEFTAVRGELTAVRGELAEQTGEVHKEIGEVHKEIGALRVAVSESSQKTSDKLDSMRRWVLGSVVTVVGAVVGSGVWLG